LPLFSTRDFSFVDGLLAAQPVQYLLERNMAVEVVTPVPTRALQPLALDDPLDATDEISLALAVGLERGRKIDAARQL
jgi:hypothetical protein